MKKILIIGSSNTDMVIKTVKLPAPGETILGGTFLLNPGGKGANQAVAATRLGGKVTFVMKRGNDLFGNQTVGLLMREGIDTEHIIKDNDNPSGVALITVDSKGENSIVVAPGANGNLHPEDISPTLFDCERYCITLLQLEIPIETVEYAALQASRCGMKVILNPAPAQPLSDKLLRNVWLATPNELEAEALSGIRINNTDDAGKAADVLVSKGVKNVIITLGATGAFVKTEKFTGLIEGIKVNAVDTTAAGDIFNGALAVALSEGNELEDAVRFANRAAAISVTRMGAQASAPFRNELE
ncbi:MAG: ribokinase [Bacteroidales bacterium]